MLQVFDLLPTHLYQGDTNTNKHVTSIGSSKTLTECGFSEYRQARVEKLRELYEQHRPEIKKTWVLPKGETDGRKSIIVEEIIGEDISPFDLPDFEEQMPNWKDYVDKYGA
jgi:hypothetical protein